MDFLIDEAAIHLAATKNIAYRSRVIERFNAFIEFLQKNNLTTRVLLPPGVSAGQDTVVMKSDLTEIGFAVVKASYDKWLRGTDKGKPIQDVSIMEKALRDLQK